MPAETEVETRKSKAKTEAVVQTKSPKAEPPRTRTRTRTEPEPVIPPKPSPIQIAPTAKPKPPSRPLPARIPPILLEGDQPSAPAIPSGPGERYAIAPRHAEIPITPETELPSAYGTEQLLLTARDPHWLYAHWDFTDEQLRRYNAQSLDHHLLLRIHADALSERAEQEIHLAPGSRHWFAHVDRAGTRYFAQLGYYGKSGRWTPVATSGATLTPPDAMSEDTSVEFATIPFEVPMEKLLTLVKEAVQENLPLAKALQEVRLEERPDLPAFPQVSGPAETAHAVAPVNGRAAHTAPAREWTPEQDRALAEIISMDHVRRVWMGSMEITELIRRQVIQELAAAAAAQRGQPAGAPTSPAPGALAPEISGAISSPALKFAGREKGFWFNINAELIIYGATEADASVTIAGRKIRLRPDGSFSYRFALPDGNYELPVVAVSADQTDGRAAELSFRRTTDYRGHVGAHPQDPNLQRPTADAI